MYQQELVPRQGRLEGLVQVATLSLQEARKSRLRYTHRPDHKLRGYFPAWTKGTMAVRQAHGQEMIDEVVGHGHFGRFTQPAPEAMFAPLEPLRIWGAIFFEKETGRGGEFEKVFVEGCCQGLLMLQYDRRGATNRGHVRVAQLDKLHELADKPLHVGSWMIARLAAHTPSPPATASAKGAHLNGRPSLACMVPCCARVWPDCTGWRQSPSRGFRGARRLVSIRTARFQCTMATSQLGGAAC